MKITKEYTLEEIREIASHPSVEEAGWNPAQLNKLADWLEPIYDGPSPPAPLPDLNTEPDE